MAHRDPREMLEFFEENPHGVISIDDLADSLSSFGIVPSDGPYRVVRYCIQQFEIQHPAPTPRGGDPSLQGGSPRYFGAANVTDETGRLVCNGRLTIELLARAASICS